MSAPASNRKWRLALAVAMLATGACARKGGDAAASTDVHPVVAARTVAVAEGAFTEVVGAIGSVVPRAGHFAVLSAPAATRVAAIAVSAGQTVRKGDTLVVLEQTDFQAALSSATAAQSAAQRSRDRWQRLVDQGIAARKDLEQANADLAKADADVVAAHRRLELATLRAPIAGVVTRMLASLGAAVDPSQPLVEVVDPAALDVVLGVPPADAARIRAGDKVTLHLGQRGTDEPLATGAVVDIAGVVDSATHSVAVRIRAVGARRTLRIGETLFGEVVIAIRSHAITIPAEALVPEGDGFQVFVVDSSGYAHARPVTVGGRTGDVAEIVKGLAAGERVVTYGAFGVDDGAKIVPAGPVEGGAPADTAHHP